MSRWWFFVAKIIPSVLFFKPVMPGHCYVSSLLMLASWVLLKYWLWSGSLWKWLIISFGVSHLAFPLLFLTDIVEMLFSTLITSTYAYSVHSYTCLLLWRWNETFHFTGDLMYWWAYFSLSEEGSVYRHQMRICSIFSHYCKNFGILQNLCNTDLCSQYFLLFNYFLGVQLSL